MPDTNYYQSAFTGKQIDEAIGKIINGKVEESVQRAEIAATEAEKSELSATRSASAAAQSQNNAKTSETNSKTSETNSKTSETNSENFSNASKSWAVGGTGVREGEDTNNAKYWAEQAHNASLIDRVLLHEYMMTYNDFVAPLATDDSVLTVIVDDENNAILANWKYKEV